MSDFNTDPSARPTASVRHQSSGATMKALYGFGKPYDFHKILPFLAGLFLLLTILAFAGGNVAQYLSTDRLACSCNLLHRVSYRCRQLCIGRDPCIAAAAFSPDRNRNRRAVPIS